MCVCVCNSVCVFPVLMWPILGFHARALDRIPAVYQIPAGTSLNDQYLHTECDKLIIFAYMWGGWVAVRM